MECLDIVPERCRISLMGNHDFAVFYEPFNFNSGAEQACFWTRNCFETDPDPIRRGKRWKFLGHHDFAVFYEPFNFNSGAEQACFWTRNCFETDPDPIRRGKRWKFLGNLPVRFKQG